MMLAVYTFLGWSIGTYWLHRAMHRFRFRYEIQHHDNLLMLPWYPFILIALIVSITLPYEIGITLACLVMETGLFNITFHDNRYHAVHHQDEKRHFAVSLTSAFTDALFGTD